MTCPLTLTYPAVFVPENRPRVVAALLSANRNGVIAPPDGENWFQADLNEMVTRNWVRQHAMRRDRMFYYRLTAEGSRVAGELAAGGWTFDGWDAWHHGVVYLPDTVFRGRRAA